MKIPPQAQCVFHGILFDVYHWQAQAFDGSYQTFEAVRRPDSAQILPTQGEQVLVAEERQPHQGPFVGLFGGRIDEGEEPLAAAQRELLEEAGLSTPDWELFATHTTAGHIDWTIYLFIARNCKKVADPTHEIGEHIQVRSLSFDELLILMTQPDFRARPLMSQLFQTELTPEQSENLKRHLFPGRS